MDIYQIMARLDAIGSKKSLTESQDMMQPVAEVRSVSEIDELYQEWVSSEDAPFDSDSGDQNTVLKKAMRFLNGRVRPDQIEDIADMLTNQWHGGEGVMGEERRSPEEFDADALAKHKARLAREKQKIGMQRKISGQDSGKPPVVREAGETFAKGDRVMYLNGFATVVSQDGDAYVVKVDGQPNTMKVPATAIKKPSYSEGVSKSKKAKPDFLDMDKDGNKKESFKKAVQDKKVAESAKPDFLDLDKDGNKKEPMKKAARDKNDAKGSFQKQMGGSAKDLTKGLSIGAKKVSEQLDEVFPGTPEYELRFGKDDASSAFDKKKISTGTVYSRRYQDEPEADDDNDTPKKKGRPVGAKRRLGAKGPGVNSKLLKGKGGLKEQDIDIRDRGEYDREGDMALNQVHQMADAVEELHSILAADENLPEWVQAKITKALDYIDTSRDYLKAKGEQYTDRGQEPMAEYSFNKTDKKDRKEPTLNLPKNTSRPMMRSKNADDDRSISSQASISRKRNYMEEPVAEKAVSRAQQKFMGMVHAAKKGAKPASAAVAKVAQGMSGKDAEDFAATKHKGLPAKKSGRVEEETTDTRDQHAEKAGKKVTKDLEYDMKHKGKDDAKAEKAGKRVTKDIEYDEKKKEKKVDETTVSGSVATSSGGDAPKKGKGGMQFGKGVYEGAITESYNRQLNSVLNEGYSVNVSVDDGGRKNITVTASDEQADQLGQMLKMAGLFSSEGYSQVCEQCHGIHEAGACGAQQVEEELANSPDEVYTDADYMTQTLSGGLNGPKTTGQTTGPVVNRQDSRQGVMAEAERVVEQSESRLWNLYKQYEKK